MKSKLGVTVPYNPQKNELQLAGLGDWDTRYTKSTLSWRGEEAKSLVRAQVISHLEWIKKGRKKGRKKREEKKIGRGVTGKICALHISTMYVSMYLGRK